MKEDMSVERELEKDQSKYKEVDFFKGVDHFNAKENIKSFVTGLGGRMVLAASFVFLVILGASTLGLKPTHYNEFYQNNYAHKIEEQKRLQAEKELKQNQENNQDVPGQNQSDNI